MYAVADPHSDHEDLAWAIMHEVTRMCYSVSEDDVARARNQLKASILFSQDGTTGGCLHLALPGLFWLGFQLGSVGLW